MKRYIIVLSSLSLGACASSEATPLIYVSAQRVGVGLAAGTAETPGAEISIGYKGIDAAYVPVAMVRECSGQEQVAEQGGDYYSNDCRRIVQISGRYDSRDSVERINNSQSQRSDSSALADETGNNEGRGDALSVFGSFSGQVDSRAGVESSVSLNLGKTFATGVAAQGFSERVGDAAIVAARSECLANLAEALEGVDMTQDANQLLRVNLARGCTNVQNNQQGK